MPVSANAFANGSNQNCGNYLTERPTTRLHAPPGGKTSFSLGWGGDDEPAPRQRPATGGPAPWGPPGERERDSTDARRYSGKGGETTSGHGRGSVAAGGNGRVSGNTFANGSNQNCGNFITDVSSTRVAAPPGGSSSFSLGWTDPATKSAPSAQGERSFGSRNPPPAHFGYAPEPAQGGRGGYGGAGGGRMPDRRSQAPPSPSEFSPPGSPQGGSSFAPQMQYSPEQHRSHAQGGPPQAFGQRTRVSSNSFANGADQNCGNFMTDVPSTRVLRPPGGSSNFSLAWDTEEVPRHSPGKAQGRDRHNSHGDYNYGGGQPSPQARQMGDRAPAGCGSPPGRDQAVAHGARPRVSGNTYANGADQNCGNVMTDTPSTRVLRPPGGSSSLNLGWD